MESIEKKKRGDIGWAVIAASIMILFTFGFLTALVGLDYNPHEDIALELTLRDPITLFKEHPEPLWHIMTKIVHKILQCKIEVAAGVVSGLCIVMTYVIAYFAIRKEVPGLKSSEIAALDFVLNVVSAIYVPFFNKYPYLGQGSPNIWHNPTSIAVKPFALFAFVLFSDMVMESRKSDFEKNIPLGKAIAAAILLILTCLAKPCFVQVFYPAIFTLMVLWLIMYKGKNFKTALQLFLVCLPSLIVMIMQLVIAFYTSGGESEGIAIMPFVVAGARTPSILISTILLLAFPVVMLVLAAIRKSLNWGDALGWFMVLWGLIWRLFLVEKGERLYHGNFSWGYMLAVFLGFYTAVKNYLKLYFRDQMTGNKRGFGFILATFVLALHFISGLYYVFYIGVLGNWI